VNPFHFKAQPSAPDHDFSVVVPTGISSKAELFTFLARAIPLPDYFGHNWDALEECLNDLDWLDHPQIAVVHRDVPLETTPQEQRTYLEILAGAAQNSDRLLVIFPEVCHPQIARILSE
jgi:RNAse (barnase) inhibitor barstar